MDAESECLLPLSLQDLCFLEVINDLDSFPVELLALLPLWLCKRILNNIPVIDLCRLSHTAVARGVAVNHKIWALKASCTKNECKPHEHEKHTQSSQHRVPHTRCITGSESHSTQRRPQVQIISHRNDVFQLSNTSCGALSSAVTAMPKILPTLEALNKVATAKERYVLRMICDRISYSDSQDSSNAIISELVSIQSNFHSLLQSFDLTLSSGNVWKKQHTALALHRIPASIPKAVRYQRLTPKDSCS